MTGFFKVTGKTGRRRHRVQRVREGLFGAYNALVLQIEERGDWVVYGVDVSHRPTTRWRDATVGDLTVEPDDRV